MDIDVWCGKKSTRLKISVQWPMCKILSYPVTCLMNLPTFPAWDMPLHDIPEIQGCELNLMHSTKGSVCFLLFQQAYSNWSFLPFSFSDSLLDSCAGSAWSKKKKAITQHITIPQSRWEIMPHTCTLSNPFTLAFFKQNRVILVSESLWTSWWSLDRNGSENQFGCK